MNNSTVQLLDLPDEMIIEILNKLNNTDVLYSILRVNKRLNCLVCDNMFTNYLNLTIKVSSYEQSSLSDAMLDRFYSLILPEIHHNIKTLFVEPLTMERILSICDYPKLDKLILSSIKPKLFLKYLSDDSSIQHIFKQITQLEFISDEHYQTREEFNVNKDFYERIFAVCQCLTHLNINGRTYRHEKLAFPLTKCSSSILIELTVNLDNLDDCLRLLDGRFSQMKTFIVKIDTVIPPKLRIKNKDILPNLTTFSLTYGPTQKYDKVILPMLRRMPNMKKLTLLLFVQNRKKFIDGPHLHDKIIMHMPQLTQFMFHITTIDHHVDISYWLKNDDIEETYIIDEGEPHIYWRIDYFTNGIGRCCISRLPLDH